jgi:hypothetical protein
MSAIPATQEMEAEKSGVQEQLWQSLGDPISKIK